MTAVCGGGTSSIKVTSLAEIAYTSGLVVELLEAASAPWLIPVIPLLALPSIFAPTFCQSDPPAMPTFTTAEAGALLTLSVGSADWQTGAAKVVNMLKNALWFQICKCDTVSTPAAPTAAAPPSTVAVPVFSSQPGVQPCNTFIYTSTNSVGGSQVLGGPLYQPLVPTSFTCTCKLTAAGNTGGSSGNFTFIEQGHGNSTLATHVIAMAPGNVKTLTFPANPLTQGILLQWDTTTANGGAYVTGTQIDAYCGGNGLPTQTSICPPDPQTLAMLEQILSLLTIVQRQSVPFAYIPGTVHGPLHGSGEFNLDGIILGLKIAVSGIDGTVGEQILDPLRLFNVGYVSIGDADGFWCQKRIENPAELYYPKFAGAATRVGWTTTSNASLTITELLREA